MTALNNLKGHIVKDGKVIYEEVLDNGLLFIIIEIYEPSYTKENYANSSNLWLEAVITDGNKHTWSNGIISLNDIEEQESRDGNGNFRTLNQLKTKDGFKVWEHEHAITSISRRIKWIIEVPKEFLENITLYKKE